MTFDAFDTLYHVKQSISEEYVGLARKYGADVKDDVSAEFRHGKYQPISGS